jgi:hypothetical protein
MRDLGHPESRWMNSHPQTRATRQMNLNPKYSQSLRVVGNQLGRYFIDDIALGERNSADPAAFSAVFHTALKRDRFVEISHCGCRSLG